MDLKHLPLQSIRRHPGRTFGLVGIVSVLSALVFAGTLVMLSLQRGLTSLENRLGADLIVAPKSASSQVDLEKILLEGVPGYFYMDKSFVDTISQVDGVEQVSAQYYLATVKAGCCTMSVQVIGFDPDTDFTIQPWIARSYSNELGAEDVVVGCNIDGAPGSSIQLYGIDCRIVSKLYETGTSLDNAVFATSRTIRDLIKGSEEQGLAVLSEGDPEEIISTVQVKLAPGASATSVADDINLHVRGVSAVATKQMTSGVADSIAAISRLIGIAVGVVVVIAALVLVLTFVVVGRQRAQEYAVLRCLGASKADLARYAYSETGILSALGAFVGIALALLVVLSFSNALEASLGLPFLLPSAAVVCTLALVSFALVVVVSIGSSTVSTRQITAIDVAALLRGE